MTIRNLARKNTSVGSWNTAIVAASMHLYRANVSSTRGAHLMSGESKAPKNAITEGKSR